MAKKNNTNVETAESTTKSNKGQPYDDVFRTLLVDCPELVIPLINEAFGEHYSRDEKVAIEDAIQKRNEVVFAFPYATVLYLRSNKNTPSRMRVTIKVPGDSARYEIPVLKVPEYTLEEIMDKELYFLIPFHLFRYEKELGIYENDEERLEELRDTYRQIVEYLNRKMEEGNLTALQCWVIQETTKKVSENPRETTSGDGYIVLIRQLINPCTMPIYNTVLNITEQ